MGCILLFKNPEDELKYLEFKRQKRIKRIHLIKKLLINKNSWILRFGYKILAKIYDCFVY